MHERWLSGIVTSRASSGVRDVSIAFEYLWKDQVPVLIPLCGFIGVVFKQDSSLFSHLLT